MLRRRAHPDGATTAGETALCRAAAGARGRCARCAPTRGITRMKEYKTAVRHAAVCRALLDAGAAVEGITEEARSRRRRRPLSAFQ